MTDTETPPAKAAEDAVAEKPVLPSRRGDAVMTSPVDLPPPTEDEPHPLLWATTAIAVATVFLLIFNASALQSWAFGLEPGPRNERIVTLADGWFQQTEKLHLERPVAAMSDWWDSVKAMEFGSEEATEAPESDRSAAPKPSENEPAAPGFSVE